MQYDLVSTPLGPVMVAGDPTGVKLITFMKGDGERRPESSWKRDPGALRRASNEIRAYFAGELEEFEMKLSLEGTPFQKRVWKAVARVPYGKTASYGQIARRLGKPDACRAVGAANGSNPIPIVIPCHRIIGSTGKLTGYGGGLWIKEALLKLENGGRQPPRQRGLFPRVRTSAARP